MLYCLARYSQIPLSPDHNFHFTYGLHATFTYDANGGQFFS